MNLGNKIFQHLRKINLYSILREVISTPWLLSCVLLCIIYIIFGGPLLVYLYKLKDHKRQLDVDGVQIVDNLIPIQLFSALTLVKLIPSKDEWSKLNEMDVELNVLKFSTGYATKFSKMNRYKPHTTIFIYWEHLAFFEIP